MPRSGTGECSHAQSASTALRLGDDAAALPAARRATAATAATAAGIRSRLFVALPAERLWSIRLGHLEAGIGVGGSGLRLCLGLTIPRQRGRFWVCLFLWGCRAGGQDAGAEVLSQVVSQEVILQLSPRNGDTGIGVFDGEPPVHGCLLCLLTLLGHWGALGLPSCCFSCLVTKGKNRRLKTKRRFYCQQLPHVAEQERRH